MNHITRTYNATIYCGFKVKDKLGRWNYPQPVNHLQDKAHKLCREYCDEVGLCVSFQPTTFIYTNGGEDGIEVGLINYPRFEQTKSQIKSHSFEIGGILMKAFNQCRVSIICGDFTYMLTNKELVEDAES